jgi:hypothetical protein
VLQQNPNMTQCEIIKRLFIGAGELNYCLKVLIDKVWVKMQKFSQSKNNFVYIYVSTSQGLSIKPALTGKFVRQNQAKKSLAGQA